MMPRGFQCLAPLLLVFAAPELLRARAFSVEPLRRVEYDVNALGDTSPHFRAEDAEDEAAGKAATNGETHLSDGLEKAAISSAQLEAVAVFHEKQNTSEYATGSNTENTFVVARRCSKFDVIVSSSASSASSTEDALGATAIATTSYTNSYAYYDSYDNYGNYGYDYDGDLGSEEEAAKKQVNGKRSRPAKSTNPNDTSEDGTPRAAEQLVQKQNEAWLEKLSNRTATCTVAACGDRVTALKKQQEELNQKCDLPNGVPYKAVACRMFCADDAVECKVYYKEFEDCIDKRKVIDDELEACERCVGGPNGSASSLAETRQTLTMEQQTRMAKWQTLKDATYKRQQQAHRIAVTDLFKAAERELIRGDAAGNPSGSGLFELDHQDYGYDDYGYYELGAASDDGYYGSGAYDDGYDELGTASDDGYYGWGAYDGYDELGAASDGGSEAGGWPSELEFNFQAESHGEDPTVRKWKAEPQSSCDNGATKCTYTVTIPCTEVVGPGTLSLSSPGSSSSIPVTSGFYVVFNPYASNDEAYMDPGVFSATELHTYLLREKEGVWRGSTANNRRKAWDVSQFDPINVKAVMQLLSRIPIAQRGQAPRVTRWMTYLISAHVIQGRWDGKYDDAFDPGHWGGSKEIFERWLQNPNEHVKYAQCWVFAGLLLSTCRALGLGTRMLSNFDSAHGSPPYNKGIDDFFTLDPDTGARVDHANKAEMIWNFHVWNDVWMKRTDLSKIDVSVDGWQAIDATPQEKSCERRPEGLLCRHMAGPAPLNALLTKNMETKGEETSFTAVSAGLSYDSMFIHGEVDGDWRGWVPRMTDWKNCSQECKPEWRGDGFCDAACNTPECDYDMGDCCEKSCTAKVNGVSLKKKYVCGDCEGTSGQATCYACQKGESLGWGVLYNNKEHIGKLLRTQKPGEDGVAFDDVWRQYKESQ